MKKIITLLLAFTLVFGASTFTYAAENDSQSEVPTHVFKNIVCTDEYGNESIYTITIKGIAGVQVTDDKCLWENYEHKYLDTFPDNPKYFVFNEKEKKFDWNGKGEFIDNGLTIIPVIKGAEMTIERISKNGYTSFEIGSFPFLDKEKTVLSNCLVPYDEYDISNTRIFNEIPQDCIEAVPFNLNGKPTGIMVVDPETYPQPSQETIDKAIADIKASSNEENTAPAEDKQTTEKTDATETTPAETTVATETADSEAVPGLDNFTVKNEYTNETFSDVADTDWFNDSVKYCFETGIMSGKGANNFDPKGSISLAEAITLAARTNNIYTGQGNEIENTGDNWYDGYVAYAIENNIIKEDQFTDYTRNITRAELAYLFAHSVASEELSAIQMYTVPDVDFDTPYSDEIFTLFNAGIVTGSDENRTFYPNNDITRGEAATLIFRVLNPDSRVSF